MRPSLQFKLNQQLAITPQLQQAIRLLQLSAFELELEIRNTLELNPLLETLEPEEEAHSTDFSKNSPDEMEYIYQAIDQFQLGKITNLDQNIDLLLQKSVETTLKQHLLWQLELAPFSARDKAIAIALIDAISEEGYILCPLSEIQQSLEIKVELSEIEAILFRIQQFDPLGVGARDLMECLNIQLNALPSAYPWLNEAKILVANYLEYLGKRDYESLKIKLKLDDTALNAVIKILTSLNPKPGTQITSQKCEYTIPDVIVLKKNGRLIVELNKGFIPELRINPSYATLINSQDLKENEQKIKTQLKEAKYFLKGIKTRNETLLKVARIIMEQQKAFLDFGEEAMKPLNLGDVSKALNLHESTISRITNQKYILTSRGIFELKYFFSHALSSPGGREISTVAVRALIKKIIAKESSQTPLSDDKISKCLSEKGINIARRTVTKYREAMHIPNAQERKGFSSIE